MQSYLIFLKVYSFQTFVGKKKKFSESKSVQEKKNNLHYSTGAIMCINILTQA